MRLVRAGLGLALCLLPGACARQEAPAADSGSPESAADGADTFQVLDLDGLADYLAPRVGDRAVVANFWATWCKPCIEEMPELVALHRDMAGEGVRVVAVSLDLAQPVKIDTAEGVREFARKRGFDLPVVAFDGDVFEAADLLDLPGPIPFTRVVNAAGEVVATHVGKADRERFEGLVRQALDGTTE